MSTKRTRNLIKMMGDYIKDDIANTSNHYYMFASKYTEWANNFVADAPNEAYFDSDFDLREEMLFGKRVTESNVTYLVDRNTWSTNQVWAMYDDQDKELESKKYYVINSNRDVFKCIYNNDGGPSTVEPTTKLIDVFELADGYRWKYMYTLSSANNTKFGSTYSIPVDANTTISSNAVAGSIECVVVTARGLKYSKYATGRIQQVISANTFKIDSEKSASNGYYENTNLFITAGTSDGDITEIVSHFTNSSGIYIKTANAITLGLDSYYLIAPKVYVQGDGTNFNAYGIVNTEMGAITGVKIVNPGQNYMTANVYFINDDPDTGRGGKIRAIISPPNGHGYDPIKELNSKKLMIKTEFANTESGTIPTKLSYRKFGLLKNPSNTFLSNTVPYTANTFDATIAMSISIQSSNTAMEKGEKFTGRTSGALGKIGFANSSYIMGTLLSGTFSNNEIIDTSNGVYGTVTGINNSDIHTDSGTILFYDTTTEIVRSNTTTEDVGLIIRLDS